MQCEEGGFICLVSLLNSALGMEVPKVFACPSPGLQDHAYFDFLSSVTCPNAEKTVLWFLTTTAL